MNSSNTAVVVGAAVCSSLAVGYLLGKLHGSRRYADDYIQRPGRESKKTEGLKTFLEYVAQHSSPEHHAVNELRKVTEFTQMGCLENRGYMGFGTERTKKGRDPGSQPSGSIGIIVFSMESRIRRSR